MESLTSMMSINATDGVQNLDDEDDVEIADHSAETSAQIFELANKFSELLQSNDVDPKDEEKKEEEEKKAKINSINESKGIVTFLSVLFSLCASVLFTINSRDFGKPATAWLTCPFTLICTLLIGRTRDPFFSFFFLFWFQFVTLLDTTETTTVDH